MVTREEGRVSGVSVTPIPKGHSVSQFWNLAHTVGITVTKLCVRVRKIFTGSTTFLAQAKIFMTRMLTRDLSAVANLLV